MKRISTSQKGQVLKLQVIGLLMSVFCLHQSVQAQFLLTQDFNSSTTVSNYVGTGTNQFDYINVSAPSGSNSVYASGNKMSVQRYSGTGALVKSTNLSATSPTFLRVSFKMNIPFNTVAPTGTQITFSVGNSFVAGTTTTGEVYFARLGVGFGSSGTYYLRNLSTFANSDSLVGEKEIHWFINKTGASTSYSFNSASNTIANNTSDVWVGNQLVFAGLPAVTATATLDNFKMLFPGANSGGGAITMDDIVISTGVNATPVTFSSFKANSVGTSNQLTWSTATEINNKGFYVERKSQSGSWESLGFVNGNNTASTYSFKDNAPLQISYYRIRQVDLDGKETFSNTVSINQKLKGLISIFPNPTTDRVVVNLSQLAGSGSITNVMLFDLTGRKLITQPVRNSITELSLTNLPNGIYTLVIQTDDTVITEKILKQ